MRHLDQHKELHLVPLNANMIICTEVTYNDIFGKQIFYIKLIHQLWLNSGGKNVRLGISNFKRYLNGKEPCVIFHPCSHSMVSVCCPSYWNLNWKHLPLSLAWRPSSSCSPARTRQPKLRPWPHPLGCIFTSHQNLHNSCKIGELKGVAAVFYNSNSSNNPGESLYSSRQTSVEVLR